MDGVEPLPFSAQASKCGFGIELIGLDSSGQVFSKGGSLLAASAHGAIVLSNCALATDQELTIRLIDIGKEIDVRVAGIMGKSDEGTRYAVLVIGPKISLWASGVPSFMVLDSLTSARGLQCRKCQTHETVQLNEIELEVLVVNGGIDRFCKACSISTIWSALGPDTVSKTVPQSAPTTAKRENNRKYGRIWLPESACVRHPNFPDEIVSCQNISRGGLCFRSDRRYLEADNIEVAVPCTDSTTENIFVSARIVEVRPQGGAFVIRAAYQKRRPRQYSGNFLLRDEYRNGDDADSQKRLPLIQKQF